MNANRGRCDNFSIGVYRRSPAVIGIVSDDSKKVESRLVATSLQCMVLMNPAQSIATADRQEGRLDLLLERAGAITRPVRCAVQPPLQLSRARYDDPARPH